MDLYNRNTFWLAKEYNLSRGKIIFDGEFGFTIEINCKIFDKSNPRYSDDTLLFTYRSGDWFELRGWQKFVSKRKIDFYLEEGDGYTELLELLYKHWLEINKIVKEEVINEIKKIRDNHQIDIFNIREEIHKAYFGNNEKREKIKKSKYFYLGRINNCTPNIIYKIGHTTNIKERNTVHSRHWKDKWVLLKYWVVNDGKKLEDIIYTKYKNRKLSTGKDFFYFNNDEVDDVYKIADNIAERVN